MKRGSRIVCSALKFALLDGVSCVAGYYILSQIPVVESSPKKFNKNNSAFKPVNRIPREYMAFTSRDMNYQPSQKMIENMCKSKSELEKTQVVPGINSAFR